MADYNGKKVNFNNKEEMDEARKYFEENGFGSSASTDEALNELINRDWVPATVAGTVLMAVAEEAADRLDDDSSAALMDTIGGIVSVLATGVAYGLHMAPVYVKSRSVTGMGASITATTTFMIEDIRQSLGSMATSVLNDFDSLVAAGVESITSPKHQSMVDTLVSVMFDAMTDSLTELTDSAFPETDSAQLLCYVGDAYRKVLDKAGDSDPDDGDHGTDQDTDHNIDHEDLPDVPYDKKSRSSYEEKLAEAMRKAGL